MKRLYGLVFNARTVRRWIDKGRRANDGNGRVQLKCHKKAGRVFVKLDDLKAYLEAS